jgi:uncharacterized protein (TIGR02466 family)
MKTLPISNTFMYEFEQEYNIADIVLEHIKNSNLQFTSNNIENKKYQYSHTGYFDLGNKKLGSYYEPNLFQWIEKCLEQVREKHFTIGKLEVCDSWVVRAKFGEIADKHFHAYSVFSGLFYVTDHPNTTTIFYPQDQLYRILYPVFGKASKELSTRIEVKPSAGKLIIWPSFIDHGIQVHKYKTTRYTVAFNSFLSGMIGDVRAGFLHNKVTNVSEQYPFPDNLQNYKW